MARYLRHRHHVMEGRQYTILDVMDPSFKSLIGRTLTVDARGSSEGLPPGYLNVSGRIEGVAGSFDFSSGVHLQKIDNKCRCTKWPWPHKKEEGCQDAEA